MKNLNAIKKIVTDGHFSEAHAAIEDLLEFGPKNVEAIKLKAALYAHVGRFEEEEMAWRRVIEIDNEDEDAIEFYQGLQLEDSERHYFTDPLPHGGRRYLAYQKTLIYSMWAALIGCGGFLMFLRNQVSTPDTAMQLLGVFIGFLATAIVAISYFYVRVIRAIHVTRDGLEVSTHVKNHMYPWKEIDQLYLAHSDDLETGTLAMVIIPKDSAMPTLSVNMTASQTSVMARRHLLAEVRDYFPAVRYEALSRVPLNTKNHRRF